jgi:uncharacterized iron-regulated membrane protein
MEAGTQGDVINPWAAAQFRSLKRADPSSPTQESAFDKWLEQTSGREQARNDRIHAATGVIPGPLWVVLIFSALAIFVYMLFFADRGGACGGPGHDDRHVAGSDRRDADPDPVPRQPVSLRLRGA